VDVCHPHVFQVGDDQLGVEHDPVEAKLEHGLPGGQGLDAGWAAREMGPVVARAGCGGRGAEDRDEEKHSDEIA
jgi:hypothetical protein